MKQYTHVSFYKFTEIADPQDLKQKLEKLTKDLDLRGTILLAAEGVNAMLAGAQESIDMFIKQLQLDERFQNILFKFNQSQTAPFKRMLIKVKKEILTFKEPTVKPYVKTGKYVRPLELKKWLDSGEDLILLDTRNDFEVKTGTFEGAINPEIKHFTHFKKAVTEKFDHLKNKKIVTFCTGGIRCEKASAYMLEQGFENVYQIEGGILKYLEETGGAFWQGECFVFDNRLAVDKDLNEVSPKN